jgi:hypothetical protein
MVTSLVLAIAGGSQRQQLTCSNLWTPNGSFSPTQAVEDGRSVTDYRWRYAKPLRHDQAV